MKKLYCLAVVITLFLGLVVINSYSVPVHEGRIRPLDETDIQDLYPPEKPSSADDYHRLGALDLVRGKTLEAGEQFREALKLDPKHVPSLSGLITVSLLLGDVEGAREFTSRMLNVQPDSAELRNKIGESWLLSQSKEYAVEAEKRFREAISLEPKFLLAHMNLARVCIYTGKIDEGIEEYKIAVSLQPKDPGIRRELAYVYLNNGFIDKGLEQAEEMVRLAPDNHVYRNGLGEIYMNEGRFQEALNEFQQTVRLKPEYARAYVNIGRIYHTNGETDRAIEEFNKAISHSPDYGEAYVMLGTVYMSKGMNQEAMEQYETAISDDNVKSVSPPNLVSVYNNLAYLYSEEGGDLDTALSYARRAYQAAPRDPNVADTLGWIHYKKGLYDEAVDNLKVAVEGSPDDPAIRYHLGAAYFKKGIKDQAVAELRKALSISDGFAGAEDAKRLLIELGEK